MKRPIATAPRTYLRRPLDTDVGSFVRSALASVELHHPYVEAPTDDASFRAWLARGRRNDIEQYLVCRRDDDRIAGFVNLNNIIKGNLQQAFIGYAGMADTAGEGHVTSGVRLALRLAFTALRLHRIEANIQPGNQGSRVVAQRAGFRLEGYSPAYLRVDGRWCDHERWAILEPDWRAAVAADRSASESSGGDAIRHH